MNRKRFIVIILLLITLGALIGRGFHTTGVVISVVAMVFYLLVDLKRVISYLRNYRRIDGLRKLRIVLWVALMLVAIGAVSGRGVYYFMLLVLLAADYMITAKQGEK